MQVGIELGLFINLPTVCRIFNYIKNKVEQVKFTVLFKKTIQDIKLPLFKDRQTQIKEALQLAFS